MKGLKKPVCIGAIFVFAACEMLAMHDDNVNAAVRISDKEETLIVGQRYKLKVKGTTKKVKWSSTKKSVARVSRKGKITAVKKGATVIKAKVGKKVLECKIKVEKPTISQNKEWLVEGESSRIYLKGNTQDVIWESLNESVVIVSNGKLTAVAEGTAKVKAIVRNKVYVCEVYVSDKSMREAVSNVTRVFELTNEYRRKYNLSPLELDYNLCMAAMIRAKELSVKFEHTRPNGELCFSVLKEYGFRMYSSRGENIACGYTTPEKVIAGWMNSEGHRARILDPDYELVGIGFYYDEKAESCYWSQFFFQK